MTVRAPRRSKFDVRRLLFPICVIVCIFIALWICGSWVLYMYSCTDELKKRDHQIRRAFKAIRVGMNREEVIRLMGEPRSQSTEFYLSQYNGFEKEYERAQSSGSAYYLIWHGGMDTTYAIGFDTNDRVTMKALGGS